MTSACTSTQITTGLKVAALVTYACDYTKTDQRAAIASPNEWFELNPVLGHHPSRLALGAYMGIMAVNLYGLGESLPDKVKPWFYGLLTLAELFADVRNYTVDYYGKPCGL